MNEQKIRDARQALFQALDALPEEAFTYFVAWAWLSPTRLGLEGLTMHDPKTPDALRVLSNAAHTYSASGLVR